MLLVPSADGSSSSSRLDALLAQAASASASRVTAMQPPASQLVTKPTMELPRTSRRAPCSSRSSCSAQEEREREQRAMAQAVMAKRLAAEYHEESERRARERGQVQAERRQARLAQAKVEVSRWRDDECAAQEKRAQLELRRQHAVDQARREQQAAVRVRRQEEQQQRADAEAVRRAAESAKAAQRRIEQRETAKVAAAALASRRAEEEAALRERMQQAALAAERAEEEARQQDPIEAARRSRPQWLARRRQRQEMEAAEREHAETMASADARLAEQAAADRQRAAAEAREAWLAEQRARLPAWREARAALRESELSEAQVRAQAEGEERRQRLLEWRRARAARHAAAGGSQTTTTEGGEGWAVAEWGSAEGLLAGRLTKHELAVTQLADGMRPRAAHVDAGADGRADDRSDAGTDGGGGAGAADGGADGRAPAAETAAGGEGRPRFLAGHERSKQAALVSYPRSGNSLLRALLEGCSGIVTGSDGFPYAPLSQDLAAFGLAGEGVSDGRVWLVKSHWPERKGCAEVRVHAAVLLVRSPVDAIDSYWNMVLTRTHTQSVRDGEYARLAAEWREHVAREAGVWGAFHRHWLATTRTPLLAIRYEDLLDAQRRAETLELVAAFLYARAAPADGASPSAAAAALRGMLDRVEAACMQSLTRDAAAADDDTDAGGGGGGGGVAGVYRPRRGRVGSGLPRFGEAERRVLSDEAGAELCLFKYDADPTSETFGLPLPGPPHAIYLDPQGAATALPTAPAAREAVCVLNRGKGLRPHEDARGWKWREALVAKRDASLLYTSESKVAHVEAR